MPRGDGPPRDLFEPDGRALSRPSFGNRAQVRRHATLILSEATVPAVIAQKFRLFMQTHSLFRFGFDVGARAHVDARIRHLAQSNRAAFEHANAAAGAAAAR